MSTTIDVGETPATPPARPAEGAHLTFRPDIEGLRAIAVTLVVLSHAGVGAFAVDNGRTSRFRDRVYVTWTTFAADGTGYIYEAHSADYGETFSAPVVVSTTSPLCDNTFALPTPQGTYNENQFSQPFTAPDGTLSGPTPARSTSSSARAPEHPAHRPRSAKAGAPNAKVANDQDVYAVAVPIR